MRIIASVMCGVMFAPPLFCAEASAQSTPVQVKPQPAVQSLGHTVRDESQVKLKRNAWTVGLAAGLPEGAPLRFAVELARVLDDGDNMRVIPMVTRGPSENIDDLLHLRGVDAAIIFGDVLETFQKDHNIANLGQRINYIMPLFPSELHVFVRPEIKTLDDLAGKPVNFNTHGTAAAYSGPIIFERLGIKVDARFVPHPVAMGEMKQSDKYAAVVFISSKPLDPFVKGKWPAGFKFLPVRLNEKLEEYYLPAQLEAEDYPGLVPEGQKIETIAVPSVLAVYNWPQNSSRGKHMARFVDYLFDRFSRLQTDAGYHPKWAELNLAATVPGWQRYAPMQAKLSQVTGAPVSERKDTAGQRAARARPIW